jgi:hypothetical protein
VGYTTVAQIIRQVCEATFEEYMNECMRTPTTPAEWTEVANKFSLRWQFHHCLGALDGKHIAMRKPRSAGSYWFNYKKFHSLVLVALVDRDYKFIWADVGCNGPSSDAEIWNDSPLKETAETGTLNLPEPDFLPHDDQHTPYFFIGDDAFSLRTWMMKPFSRQNMAPEERIFNYRLSRARRILENAFGNRRGCLLTTLKFEPVTALAITQACMCMHNLMRIRYPGIHAECPSGS